MRIHPVRSAAPRVRLEPSYTRTVVEGVLALLTLVVLVGGLAAVATWGVLALVAIAL
ncbi:hypothetical protein [Nocardioides guangzhouensis]|uniref:hypothetical protein n=1 Tax=Nocardioides guangzhouensis TaxID=2497878 RepID=UPI0014383255|nr:hypothetical protein [Nocardioides guangzhouensis]